MRRLVFLPILFLLGGCAPSYLVAFSQGYNPATSYTHSLPAMVLEPGETRMAFLPAARPPLLPQSSVRIASENPEVVLIWKKFSPGDAIRLQALVPGTAIIHRGDFPFPDWKLERDVVERAAWRAAVRRHLHPHPDDVAFRAMSDEEIWKRVLRSRSQGALRVVVERDRLNFQQR